MPPVHHLGPGRDLGLSKNDRHVGTAQPPAVTAVAKGRSVLVSVLAGPCARCKPRSRLAQRVFSDT
jgi:hypothetical protein